MVIGILILGDQVELWLVWDFNSTGYQYS